VKVFPVLLGLVAALHLVYLFRLAGGAEVVPSSRQENAVVVWLAKEFGFGGVVGFAVIDVLVIAACIRSMRGKK
jgi:hypothetical protein